MSTPDMTKEIVEFTPEIVSRWGYTDFEELSSHSIDICFEPGPGVMQFCEGLVKVSTRRSSILDVEELKQKVKNYMDLSSFMEGTYLQMELINKLKEWGYKVEAKALITAIKSSIEV